MQVATFFGGNLQGSGVYENPGGQIEMARANNAHALNISKSASERVAREGIRKQDPILFGMGMHTIADYLPHANTIGKPTFGHREEGLSNIFGSHMFSTFADTTGKNPERALATIKEFRKQWLNYLYNIDRNEAPNFQQEELSELASFIYARNPEEKNNAILNGLRRIGATQQEIQDFSRLYGSVSRRREEWNHIMSTEKGSRSASEAWRIWLETSPSNFQLFNRKRIDISKELSNLPSITDPYTKR